MKMVPLVLVYKREKAFLLSTLQTPPCTRRMPQCSGPLDYKVYKKFNRTSPLKSADPASIFSTFQDLF